MVLVSVHDLDDDVYPGVQEYAKCQSKAFFKGFIGFIAGGAAGLTGSIFARQRFPARFAPVHTVSVIAGGGIVFGYLAAYVASRECQRNWVRTAQAAGYTDDLPSSSTTSSPSPLQTPSSQGTQSQQKDVSLQQALSPAPAQGRNEIDGPVIKKTKYGDTMG